MVYTVAVHPSFQRQGVGRRLMEFVMDRSLQKEEKAIKLNVYENNSPAIRLYQSFGFERVSKVGQALDMRNMDCWTGLNFIKRYFKAVRNGRV